MKIQGPDGKTIEIQVAPGQPPPTDAEIDQLFATQARREAVVAPAMAGAIDRRNQANQAAIEQADPRLKAANELDTERAVDMLPVTSSLAIGPAAGVPGMIGTAARAALANPEVTGAVLGAAKPLMQGDLPGAAKGAFWGALGGKVGGPHAAKLLKFLSRAAPEAAAATTAAATEAAPAARAAAVGLTEKQAARTFAPGGENMKDIAEKIIGWRQKQGFSAGQIADSLREQYKIPLAIGKKMAEQVISSLE